jgi:hypothetical protein
LPGRRRKNKKEGEKVAWWLSSVVDSDGGGGHAILVHGEDDNSVSNLAKGYGPDVVAWATERKDGPLGEERKWRGLGRWRESGPEEKRRVFLLLKLFPFLFFFDF